ncbi:hypothetical protein NEOLI_005264 [Neolecta irregularis DAH-3]|uniref:Uncharacterized protein n=1 Tax=Neolecta irregularis (strain DAH-3) TaxID=1198029 RepID=A0A1U7LHN5_NEOID|nr:hypothetical protein NEOLI_005264 [Neolecta irregularis DAH-3]|eukprot:OLL22170.1 hypothetical protein NEOLI_005264 [Neolecta irregularis DAH-3]
MFLLLLATSLLSHVTGTHHQLTPRPPKYFTLSPHGHDNPLAHLKVAFNAEGFSLTSTQSSVFSYESRTTFMFTSDWNGEASSRVGVNSETGAIELLGTRNDLPGYAAPLNVGGNLGFMVNNNVLTTFKACEITHDHYKVTFAENESASDCIQINLSITEDHNIKKGVALVSGIKLTNAINGGLFYNHEKDREEVEQEFHDREAKAWQGERKLQPNFSTAMQLSKKIKFTQAEDA